ncbi:MAG: DMT family transporter [Microthrixaceae bacterium]|nr:DMT family transporter [Microthrixaceae bacterium]
MAVLLATLSSLVYGTADFLGGMASRRNDGMVVTVVSQTFGCLALAIAVLLWPEVTVEASDLWWGALGGVGGGLGLMCFYPALAIGPMSVVAPTTAVCSAVVPLVAGLAIGDRPSGPAMAGVLLALPAIVLVARESGSHGRAQPQTVMMSIAAGVGFGWFFIGVSQTSEHSGLWPLVGARVVSIGLVGTACLLSGRSLRPAVGTTPLVASAGMLDLAANALYLFAATRGLLSVVAVLGSLYPASTVLLAMWFLHERMSRAQAVGVAMAVAAVALIAVGS